MSSTAKVILLSFLLVLLLAQSTPTTYAVGSQTYEYIYGTGPQADSNLGNRLDASPTAFIADSTYVPPITSSPQQTINCPINQVYNNILCQCVCILGYYSKNGACVAFDPFNPVCGRNQAYRDKRCVCDYGYSLIGTICDVCPPYSTYALSTLSCNCIIGYQLVQGICLKIYVPPPPPIVNPVPQCRLNEVLVNGICNCLPDFYLVAGVCTYCVTPNYYDPQMAICRPTCGIREQLDLASLKCVCIGGFKRVNGICGSCPAYAVYNVNTQRCDCINGYTFSSGFCIPATTAPLPPTPTPIPPRDCADINAYLLNGVCVCKSTWFLIGSVCRQCAPNTFYDADLAICRIACLANQAYDIVSAQCKCAKTYFRINNICQQCKGTSTYSAQTQTCVCPPGFRIDGLGNCIVGCGVNEVFRNGQCCCQAGFYPVGGICGMCAWNQIYDQGLGLCRVPCDYKMIFDISQKRCVCLPQYFEMNDGSCDVCVLHSNYDQLTKTCPCDLGYIKNLGLCTPSCNSYELYVNGRCVCREGYYLIGYSCGLCPPTQTYDAIYRICHATCQNNQVWDPMIRACRCLPGFYLIQGTCTQCDPRTQFYDQKTQCCLCKQGYKKRSGQGCQGVCEPICSVNEDWILNRCVCKPGFYLINNYCTQCPSGQFYDIYQRICRVKCSTNQVYNFNSGECDCADGFYLIHSICSKCQEDETYSEYTMTCNSVPCKGVNEFYSATTSTCICTTQTVRIRGVCTNCSPGQYYDSYSDRCLCKPGYTQKNGFCEPMCPRDSIYINGRCICSNGLPVNNGECRVPMVCPLYSSFNKLADCCVCNAGYRVINGKCSSYQYCGQNGYLKYGQCYCNDGYFWILGACRQCGVNEAFNGLVCECYLGYNRDINGNCAVSTVVPKCYENQRYDATVKACVCVATTQFVRGKCITIPTCQAFAYYNSVECVCLSGYKKDVSGRCVSADIPIPICPGNSFFNGVGCTCNIGVFQQSLNSCEACAAGTVWNGQVCANIPPQTCLAGYIYNANIRQCEASAPSCGDNSYFNGATCVCVTDYSKINGVCQRCPAGTIFDGVQCASSPSIPDVKCKSNQVVVSSKCVCNAGLYLIGQECLACPAYTTWNGKYCQCGCDTAEWCLGQPFSVWNTADKICNCASGYIRVNGICSKA